MPRYSLQGTPRHPTSRTSSRPKQDALKTLSAATFAPSRPYPLTDFLVSRPFHQAGTGNPLRRRHDTTRPGEATPYHGSPVGARHRLGRGGAPAQGGDLVPHRAGRAGGAGQGPRGPDEERRARGRRRRQRRVHAQAAANRHRADQGHLRPVAQAHRRGHRQARGADRRGRGRERCERGGSGARPGRAERGQDGVRGGRGLRCG